MTSGACLSLRYAPRMTDEAPGALVRAAAAGDERAWAQLVARFDGLVWSIAPSFRFGQADAGDIVQTTWLRLVEHLDRVQQPDRVGAWLATTARHECLALLRRKARQGVGDDEIEEVADTQAAPDAAILDRERDAVVWAALERISEPCRRLLRILASDPSPSYHEVGAALDMPIGSIGPTRARCLDSLRRQLASDLSGWA
jgi:RNA polymerase sigma factor (sigma-70 family)